MAGLPMDRLINRLGLARLEAEQRAEAELAARREREAIETAAQLKQQADERVWQIEVAAMFEMDDVVLSRIREDKAAAERVERVRKAIVDKLYDRVYSRISRRDVADLWLTAQWKELGGVKPVDFCKDEKTLARCLEVLEEFAANEQKRRRR